MEKSRKEIIKKAAVIFLAAMLVLTFFSNTIMNYSLPEVATEPVYSGSVSNKVRGQGAVEANSDYEVTVSGARVIKEVKVEVGDSVEKGQVLFTFEEGENTELTEAQDTLDQMELDYAKSLLKSMPDYESDNMDIKSAKEDLEAAVKARDKAKTTEKNLKSAKSAEEAAKKNVAALEEKIEALQEQIETYGTVGSYEEASAQVTALSDELATLKSQLQSLNDELASAKGEEVSELRRDIQNKELEITNKTSELNAAKQTAAAIQNTSATYNSLKSQLNTANKDLKKAQSTLQDKSAEVERLSAQPTLADARAAVKEKQKALTQMLLALKQKKEQDSLAQQSEDLDMKAAGERLEKQRELVDKLTNSNDLKEVKSKDAGVVSQIDFKAGDSVTADVPLAKIQLAESGYIVTVQVTKAQANLVRTGNEATIENIWDDDVSATVKSIKADPENPNQNMLITFEVKGNVSIGQNLALSVGEKSNRYDAVVPNNAVREDSKGKFVLVVTVKGTPLGNRYKVKRADVEVLASDDSYTGLQGGVYEGDNVVTNSSQPLEEGMQVRLVE